MLENYWPTGEECKRCINTDAEATAEHVLLAVHEPMTLSLKQNGKIESGDKTEYDFLDHILNTEYPVPILGPAGSGKSHIVRWLDAKLKVRPECADWHIKRIPKSASLRDVLTILLDGLDGADFERVRADIKYVGDNLRTDQVADILIQFINHALSDLFDRSQVEKKNLIDTGNEPSAAKLERFSMLERHANGGLQALLGDPNFKKGLVHKEKCIYQLASRFTKGGTGEDDQWADGDFVDEITLDDLDFKYNFNLNDLSAEARTYIRNKGLTTNAQTHQEAVDLLNEVLQSAMHKAFSNFYQFQQGSFIDLFNAIRRHLKKQNKTLVVLVEDLASISAIKDVLLDSLLKDSTYAGVQELCSIRSVFAVTSGSSGYRGYAERSGTIGSRQGGVEWHIESSSSDEDATIRRIEDFCGRYLNAARFGSSQLEADYDRAGEHQNWPSVWHENDQDLRDSVEQFGVSSKGYPLFPFNKAAIRALSFTHCSESSVLKFKPRTIIIKVLKGILVSFREKYIENEFPKFVITDSQLQMPTGLAQALQSALSTQNIGDKNKALIAFWGYRATTLSELADMLPPAIAKEFGCDDLFNLLTDTAPVSPDPQPVIPIREHVRPVVNPIDPPIDELTRLARTVDGWFKNKEIPQQEAKLIRQNLRDAVTSCWKDFYGEWVGVKNLPKAWGESGPPIYIHHNANNPDTLKLFGYFGDEKKGYGDDAAKYKGFIIAFLRHRVMGSWRYNGGYEDYCRYQEFINDWVPVTCSNIVRKCREDAGEAIKTQINGAVLFHPTIGAKTDSQKLEILCQTADKLSPGLASTGIDDWDNYKQDKIDNWEQRQALWIGNFVTGENYALEGDMIKKLLRGAIDAESPVPREVQKKAQQASKSILLQFKHLELIKGCNTQDAFNQLLKEIKEVVEALNDAKQYQVTSDMTARKVINLIKKIGDDETWPVAKALLVFDAAFEPKKVVQNLNNFDEAKTRDLDQLLSAWKEIYAKNFGRLKIENIRRGSEERVEGKKYIHAKIKECNDVLIQLKESLL